MTMMIRTFQILLVSLALTEQGSVVAAASSSGPWSLPSTFKARIPATSTKLEDFQRRSRPLSPLLLVTGGDQTQTPPPPDQTADIHTAAGGGGGGEIDDPKSNLSDDIARGGGAAVKKQKKATEEEQSLGKNSTSTASPSVEKTTKETTTSPTVSAAAAAKKTVGTPVEKRKGLARFIPHRKNPNHKAIAKKLKNRNHTNLRRKVMHASFGIFFASLNHFIPREKFVPGMAILSSATLLMELLRYRKGFGWMNNALHFVLGSSLRKHEMDGKFTGSFYFFTGVTLTSYLFPKTCATLGICQLALADPSASYFGRATRHIYWSRIENGLGGFGRNKGILGFLGGAAFCFPFNYRVLSVAKFGATGIPGGQTSLVAASALLGLAGAFADLAVPTPAWTLPRKICGVRVPPFHLDDNFVVPIFSGFACTKIFKLLGWSQNLALSTFVLI